MGGVRESGDAQKKELIYRSLSTFAGSKCSKHAANQRLSLYARYHSCKTIFYAWQLVDDSDSGRPGCPIERERRCR